MSETKQKLERIRDIAYDSFTGSFPENFAGRLADEYRNKLHNIRRLATEALEKCE